MRDLFSHVHVYIRTYVRVGHAQKCQFALICTHVHAQELMHLLFAPREDPRSYNTSFILLKEAVQNIGLEFDPQKVLTDFELALQQSIAISFPQAEKKGCLFHYSQAI